MFQQIRKQLAGVDRRNIGYIEDALQEASICPSKEAQIDKSTEPAKLPNSRSYQMIECGGYSCIYKDRYIRVKFQIFAKTKSAANFAKLEATKADKMFVSSNLPCLHRCRYIRV